MSVLEGFVDLNRQFSLRDPKASAEELADISCDSMAWHRKSNFVDWDKIISGKGIAIILGEPGSGRTWEFRSQEAKLSDSGKTSFYVQLQHLASHNLDELIDTDEFHPFEEWRTSEKDAWFFLDAVDEAKLRSVTDFESAMRNFRKSVGSNGITRARVLISCRIHQWDHEADSARVRKHLQLASTTVSAEQTNKEDASDGGNAARWLQVWVMQPLDRERIALYARHK